MPTVLRVGSYRFYFYSADAFEQELNRIVGLVSEHRDHLLRAWNEFFARELASPPRASSVAVTDDTLVVELEDGRTLSAPLAWYPRLVHATAAERANWRLIGRGEGIHWPAVDEDISVESLLAGRASGETHDSLQRWLAARGSAA